MSSLRQAAQQALAALEWNYNTDLDNIPACEQWAKMLKETITALRVALAEPQTTHWEGCEAVHPKCRKTEQEPVAHSVIAGALFDFMGWLTSRRERLVLSSVDNAAPAADAIKDFAEMRGLNIDDALVKEWQDNITAPTPRKPLTDEEIGKIAGDCLDAWSCARAIERAHGIGEQHD